MRYIESQVYQGVVENVASEMAARMVAMKAATDNAGNLIQDLQLVYNKAARLRSRRNFPRSSAAPRPFSAAREGILREIRDDQFC